MKKLVLTAALLGACFSAQASEIKYSYVEAGFNTMQENYIDNVFLGVSGKGASLNGFNVKGSVGFKEHYYIFADYRSNGDSKTISFEGSPAKLSGDFDDSNIGFGFHTALTENTDWLIELAHARQVLDLRLEGEGQEKYSDNGYRLASGIRSMATEKVELFGKLNYLHMDNFGKGFGATVGAQYHFNNTWGLTFDYATQHYNSELGTISTWGLGVRASF